MELMMEANFDELVQNEPIEVKYKRNKDGKKMGKGRKPLFIIINGRHRVTRAIIEGKSELPVIILDEDDDATKVGKKYKKSHSYKRKIRKSRK